MLDFIDFRNDENNKDTAQKLAPGAKANKAAIIFVHGFTGDVRTTWRSIPAYLKPMDALQDWDLRGFGYHSSKLFDLVGLWSADAKLEEIAIKLAEHPEIKHYETVAFVAHSMGGLVVQQALVTDAALRKRTSHVVLFGTPSKGLVKARALFFWKRQIQNMEAGGAFITRLRAAWDKLKLDTVPQFTFTTVAGEMDQFVPPGSSLADFPSSTQRVIPGNHITMLDAKSPNDSCVQILVQSIVGDKAAIGVQSSANVSIQLGRFRNVIRQLWPGRDGPDSPPPDGLDDHAAVLLAIALEQTGSREDAMRLLLAHKPSGTDALGTLAGRFKRRWLFNRKRDDLTKAIELYQAAYNQATGKSSPDHDQAYYHGINLAYLVLVGTGDRPAAEKMAEAVLDHCRHAKDPAKNHWVLPTQGDALLILGQIPEGLKHHKDAAAQQLEPWEAQSMEEQALQLAGYLKLPESQVKAMADCYERGIS